MTYKKKTVTNKTGINYTKQPIILNGNQFIVDGKGVGGGGCIAKFGLEMFNLLPMCQFLL